MAKENSEQNDFMHLLENMSGRLKNAASSVSSSISESLTSFNEQRTTKRDQIKRLAIAAFLNAEDPTDKTSLNKWVENTFKKGNDLDFRQGPAIADIKAKDVQKLLDSLSKKQVKNLVEQRNELLSTQANIFFKEHGKVKEQNAPESRDKKDFNWKNPLQISFELGARGFEALKQSRFTSKSIEEEQKERIIAAAFQQSDDVTEKGIRTWLQTAFDKEKGFIVDNFKGEHKKVEVNIGDVMKHFKRLSSDHRNELIVARNDYRDSSNAKERTNNAIQEIQNLDIV